MYISLFVVVLGMVVSAFYLDYLKKIIYCNVMLSVFRHSGTTYFCKQRTLGFKASRLRPVC